MEMDNANSNQEDRSVTQAKLAAIVESSDDAIVSKTLDGIIMTWNAGARRIFGYTAEEVIGKPLTIIIPPNRLEEEPKILERLRAGERIDHFETVRMTKDGALVEVSVTISPIKNDKGIIVGASKIARDITASKQILRELESAKESAEAASRAKDQFLSVLSHELRTPLTPVLFALSSLEGRDDLPRDAREDVAMARRNIETEARLVDDLLDLTRISRGKVELLLEVVDIHRTIRTVLQIIQPVVDEKNIDISVSLRAKQHHVWADPGRLQQIVLNVLSNAAKFTPPAGTIMVRAINPQPDRISIEITDTGIGMEPEMLARLFKPFEQAEPAIGRRFGGVGLGLSIARSLAELHGGTLIASSAGKGKGSTFVMGLNTIAAPDISPKTELKAENTLTRALRVLLVEDHSDTRMVVSRLLTRLGCMVTGAANVKEALTLADLHSFDLLISDIGLPDGTGLDVMRHMRSHQAIKGIALSGFGQEDDLQRSAEAGFTVHLTKPINFQLLEETIHKMVEVS
jgi:PAS domain S-box-containing protein